MCNVNLTAIQNVVIGSYFTIYNDELVIRLHLVLQETEL